jgi:tetratricopeptide (TPR) repeat protein
MSTAVTPINPANVTPEMDAHQASVRGRATGAEWSDAVLVALLLLVTFACYSNILANSFAYDDGQQILQNPYVKSWHYLPQIFGTTVWSFVGQAGATNYYRPLMTFSFLLLWQIFGALPFGFHLFSLWLQCAVVVTMFFAGRRLFHDVRIAWLAALLFAVHPIHTEAVAWIAALPDLEAGFLLLLALWLLTDPAGASWKRQLGVTLCFCLALLCKEPALMFAPLAVAFEHLVAANRKNTTFLQKILNYLPLAAAAIAYLLLRIALFGKLAPVLQHPKITWPQSIYSAFAMVLDYTRLLLWPSGLSAFRVFHVSTALADAQVVGGILICVLCLVVIFSLRTSAPATAFAVLWIGVTLAPVLNARWMAANVETERYLYLPSIGFCWLAAWCAIRLWDAISPHGAARAVRVALATVLVALLVAGGRATVRRNLDWQNDFVLYTKTLHTNPDAHVIRSNLAGIYFEQGDLARAGKEWEQALAGKPDNVNTMNALGILYTKQGRFAEAKVMLDRAMAAKPLWGDPHYATGLLLEKQGDQTAALVEFQSAIRLAPLNPVAHYWYGDALLKANRVAEAEAQFERTLALGPDAPLGALTALTSIYLNSGRTARAEPILRRLVSQYPYDGTAHFQLAHVLEDRGQRAEALQEYTLGLALEPENTDAQGAVQRLKSVIPRP